MFSTIVEQTMTTGLPLRGAMANLGIFMLWFCVLH
jgi:hypothetical protein